MITTIYLISVSYASLAAFLDDSIETASMASPAKAHFVQIFTVVFKFRTDRRLFTWSGPPKLSIIAEKSQKYFNDTVVFQILVNISDIFLCDIMLFL